MMPRSRPSSTIRSSLTAWASITVLATLAIPMAALACSTNQSATLVPRTSSTRTTGPALTVPFIVGDPMPDPPVGPRLARSRWAAVYTGDPNLADPVRFDLLTVAVGWVPVDGTQRDTVERLRDMKPNARHPAGLGFVADRDELRSLGFEPPWPDVWLIGAEGPCHASIGEPMIAESQDHTSWTIAYALLGCAGSQWAPAAITTDRLPPDVRILPAITQARFESDSETAWDHPLATIASSPDGPDTPIERELAWVLEVPLEGDDRPIEVVWSRSTTPEPNECFADEQTETTHGWWDGETFQSEIPVPEAHDIPILLGGFVSDDGLLALYYRDGGDLWISVRDMEQDTWNPISVRRSLDGQRPDLGYYISLDHCTDLSTP